MEGSGDVSATECSKTSPSNEIVDESDDESKPKNGGSSSNSTVEENDKKQPSVRPYVRSKMPRLRWTPDLHLRFLHAVQKLGGQDIATPKLVLQMMNIKGLSIAHVKSHLQMYRSKKIDDPGQVMANHRHLVESADRNIFNLSQLPMLQGYNYNQSHTSSFRYGDASWSPARGYLMRNPYTSRSSIDETRPRLYGTVASNIFDSNNCNWTTSSNIQTSFNSHHPRQTQSRLLCPIQLNPVTQQHAKIEECRSNTTTTTLMKRKATDCRIDLDLSLRMNPSSNEGESRPPRRSLEEENINEVDSELSLSLCSPPSSSPKHSRLLKDGGENHNFRNNKEHHAIITKASTLDLTI